MLKRIKAAFRTNEPQFTSVFLFTLLNVAAVASRGDAAWYVYLLALGMWPTFAFCANLVDPIPESKDGER